MDENRQLKIEEPCHIRWAELDGTGARRFCGQCALHVVDGSTMTKSAAADLVDASEERVCMRVEVDGQGRPVHVPETTAAGRVLSRIAWTVASGLLVSCVDDEAKAPAHADPEPTTGSGTEVVTTAPPMERPIEIMGEVCYFEELPEESGNDRGAEVVNENEPLSPNAEILGRMMVHPSEGSPAPETKEPD